MQLAIALVVSVVLASNFSSEKNIENQYKI
jgi:hypothetical protein